MKTIAVTGSSGFIGKHLLKILNKKNCNIIELDVKKGKDLLNKNDLDRIEKFDIIIHLAAKSFVPLAFEQPWNFYFNNYNITLNVLELARKFKARVIYFSSYLYGIPEYLPIDENHPLRPHNPYAQTKLICEKLCEGYNRDFHVPVIIFRPFNIYGPGQDSNFIIPRIIEQIKTGEILLKDSRPRRDFIYVQDVINAILLALDYDKSDFEIFNLGCGKSYAIADIIGKIENQINSKLKIKYNNETRRGEITETIADIRKALHMPPISICF